MLALVGLPGFERRDVNTLSGGEQQRVALARSLAPRPRLLMLDEPLGALDRALRERLVFDLRRILREMRQTALYVTHDQEEAFVLAHRVVLFNAGRVEQIDTPQALYRHPASLFVARFLGLTNLLPGEAQRKGDAWVVKTALGELPLAEAAQGKVTILLRPDTVQRGGNGRCQVEGRVTEVSFRGSSWRTVVDVAGVLLRFDFSAVEDIPEAGETIRLTFDPETALQVFAG
jgi:ABC-type Fe3+/spermidine/putrescine transport system ATPase subunit